MRHNFNSIALCLTAILLFALTEATAKYLSAFFPVPLLVWARYSVHLVIMLVCIAPRMGREVIVTQRPWLMTFRAFILVCATLFVMSALRNLPLAETTALTFVTPLLVALLAGPLLGEKVRLISWLATIGGFGGVLLIARPGGTLIGIGVIYALGAALCNAIYQLLTRKLSSTEPTMRQLFYTALVGTIMMSFIVPAYWNGKMPSLYQALLMASLGFNAGIGHFLFIRAFRESPASILSPLIYTQLIWALLLGWIIFGQLPDLLAIVGMLIIGAACLTLALRRSEQ